MFYRDDVTNAILIIRIITHPIQPKDQTHNPSNNVSYILEIYQAYTVCYRMKLKFKYTDHLSQSKCI